MVELLNRLAVGPFALTRPLGPGPRGAAERFLALHEVDHSSHVAFRFPKSGDRVSLRRFFAAVRACETLSHEHLLTIEYHTVDPEGHPWVVSPFTGDVDGVRTLERLLRDKQVGGGHMHPMEVERAVQHLLEAAAHAHTAKSPVVHGPLRMDEILIDRHGRIVIELYGLGRLLSEGGGAAAGSELIRDELRSIAQIGYELLTSLRAEPPMIPAGRVVKRLDARWDRWLARGLDAVSGFASADEALAMLPSRTPADGLLEPVTVGGVRGVFSRFKPGRW